ncbi:hypothetical protein KAH55_06435, partial [bacterium]|nr:hypothetical protein [bacterium]
MNKNALRVIYYGSAADTGTAVSSALEDDNYPAKLLKTDKFSLVESEIQGRRCDVLLIETPLCAEDIPSVLSLVKMNAVFVLTFLLVNDFTDP